MTRPIISVESLGKAYKLGLKEEKYPTFREALVGAVRAPLARFRHLSRNSSHDEMFWALRDVSFEVHRGEVVGIIGRNGAGKSTLLKILSRITEPTTGRAVLRGRVASLLEVGTGFHPELTGRENVYLNGSILGMKKVEIDRKFDEIVEFCEVEKFLDTPVKRYSSGMYVRLAFAVAAHLEPEILIVDEVLAVGDIEFQKKCLGKIREVSKRQARTVMFVSHNMAAVSSLCDRAFLIDEGRMKTDGNATRTISDYLSARTSPEAAKCQYESNHFVFKGVRVEGAGDQAVFSLAPAVITVDYQTKSSFLPGAHIYVEDEAGTLIFGINSSDFCCHRVSAMERSAFRFSIESLPLNAGNYRLRILLRNDSTFESWELPILHEFEVRPSSVYGSRMVTRQHFGYVAVRAQVDTVSATSH